MGRPMPPVLSNLHSIQEAGEMVDAIRGSESAKEAIADAMPNDVHSTHIPRRLNTLGEALARLAAIAKSQG